MQLKLKKKKNLHAKDKQFLFRIRQPPYYSVQSIVIGYFCQTVRDDDRQLFVAMTST
jgi:hypothetical protein